MICIFSFIDAQRPKRNKDKGNIGEYALVSFSRPVSKDSIKVTTFVEIPFRSLQFIKRKPNFVASYNLSIILKNNEQKQVITNLKPENRYYPVKNNFTTEASIHTNLLRDLYIVLGEGNMNDGWTVRIYNNPLVIWIWIGSLVVFIGGLISTNNNLNKIKFL